MFVAPIVVASLLSAGPGAITATSDHHNLAVSQTEARIFLAKGAKPITPKFNQAAKKPVANKAPPKAKKPAPTAKKPVTSIKKPFTEAAKKPARVFHPKPISEKGPFIHKDQKQPQPVLQPKGTAVAPKKVGPVVRLKSIYNYHSQKKMSYDFSQASK